MSRRRHAFEALSRYSARRMARVLIVDDELDLVQLVEFNLRREGIDTAIALSGEDALASAARTRPDLIILDLMLPDLSGLEVCRQLRREPRTQDVPVLMLTARGEELDRVVGFETGADDYVSKPFSVRELVLRVRALLRRQNQSASSETLVVGALALDLAAHRAFVDGQEIAVTALEFRFLHYLMARPGRVQTRHQLLADVWGFSAPMETRTIDTHVMRLREKLGKARHQLETVRGVGFRLVESPEE